MPPFLLTICYTVGCMASIQDIPWLWLGVGVMLGAWVMAVWRFVERRRTRRPAVPFEPTEPGVPRKRPPAVQRIIASKRGESVKLGVGSLVSEATLKALHDGKELYELGYDALEEVVAEADARTLDELEDNVLRRRIVKCVSTRHGKTLLPAYADALWGCVLGWDPFPEKLEKQSLDLLSWSCRYFGEFPGAKPVTPHSTHDIPVPLSLPLTADSSLTFDHIPNTLVGEGATSAVYRAQLEDHEDVAVKISRLTDHYILRSMLSEYLMLRRASDLSGVIKLYGGGYYEVGDSSYMIIVEELADTTLADVFERRKVAGESFSEEEVRETLVKPMLKTLKGLHDRGILHRDVKPTNIHYIDGEYRLGDFEIAAYAHDEDRTLSTGTFAGSPAFSTAAALKGRYGPHTDINALACIAHMLLRGDLPAMEDAPGTSTLVRGIGGGVALTEDEMLQQEKAKAALNDWLIQRKRSVQEIQDSPYSTAFERFFVAPIMSQGLYAELAPGSIATADDAMAALERIELSEQTRETCRRAMALAREGRKDEARDLLESFDKTLRRPTTHKTEITMHVMICNTLNDIEDVEPANREI